MGYEITIKIKEYDERFKSSYREPIRPDELLADKVALEGYCLYPEESEGLLRLHQIAKSLMFHIRCYVNRVVQSWKLQKEKQFNESPPDEDGYRELYYCGWGFAHEDSSEDTVESRIELFFEELFFLVITPTPDRFEHDESNRYEKKLEQVKEVIDEIEGIIWEIMDHEFLDFYRAREDTKVEESY